MMKIVKPLLVILGAFSCGVLFSLALLYLGYRIGIIPQSSVQEKTESVIVDSQTEILPASLPSYVIKTPNANFSISQEQIIGEYVYRVWVKDMDDSSTMEDSFGEEIVTLSLLNSPNVNIKEFEGVFVRVDLLSGRDITGEGNPDLVVQTFSGGAHCCFQTFVVDLGDTSISDVLATPYSNCHGEFKDLDYDGSYEFITCDDILAYQYCSFASSPFAPVILKYAKGDGYLPATPNFSYDYDINTRILADIYRAEQGLKQEDEYWDKNENVMCPAIQVAMDYLYIGDAEKAEQEFRRLYLDSNADAVWLEFNKIIEKSPLYTPYQLEMDP